MGFCGFDHFNSISFSQAGDVRLVMHLYSRPYIITCLKRLTSYFKLNPGHVEYNVNVLILK